MLPQKLEECDDIAEVYALVAIEVKKFGMLQNSGRAQVLIEKQDIGGIQPAIPVDVLKEAVSVQVLGR